MGLPLVCAKRGRYQSGVFLNDIIFIYVQEVSAEQLIHLITTFCEMNARSILFKYGLMANAFSNSKI